MIAEFLQEFSRSLKKPGFEPLKTFYSEKFAGSSLGLTRLVLSRERDKVRTYKFVGGGELTGRERAVTEWRNYTASFDDIEFVGMYVHRLEKWKATGPAVAVVRFEHIGKPWDAPRSCIDRAYFRMAFERTGDGLRIGFQSLVSGDRV